MIPRTLPVVAILACIVTCSCQKSGNTQTRSDISLQDSPPSEITCRPTQITAFRNGISTAFKVKYDNAGNLVSIANANNTSGNSNLYFHYYADGKTKDIIVQLIIGTRKRLLWQRLLYFPGKILDSTYQFDSPGIPEEPIRDPAGIGSPNYYDLDAQDRIKDIATIPQGTIAITYNYDANGNRIMNNGETYDKKISFYRVSRTLELLTFNFSVNNQIYKQPWIHNLVPQMVPDDYNSNKYPTKFKVQRGATDEGQFLREWKADSVHIKYDCGGLSAIDN